MTGPTSESGPRPATGGRRRLFIAGAALAAASSTATILGLPAVMPLLLDAFAISHGQGGLIVTALWIPHAISQALTGWLAEAIGVQRLLRWTLAGLACLVALSLLAPAYWVLMGLRMLTGVCTGASFVLAILYAASHSDPAAHRRDQALVGSLGHGSGALAYATMPVFLAAAGWRAGYVPALCFILSALGLALVAPPGPARPHDVARLPLQEAVRVVWVGRIPILALANLCTFGIFVMVATWLTSYFVRESGLSLTTSLYVSAAVLGAGAMGRFAGGALLGRIPDRPLVMLALALSGAALAGLALSPAFPAAPVLAFVALACCSLTYGSIFAMALGRRPPAEAGVAVSAVSFLAGLGGSILPAVMGWFVDRTGSFGPGFGMLSLLTYAAILLLAAFPPGGNHGRGPGRR